MNEIPHDEGLFGQTLIGQQLRRIRGHRQARDRDSSRGNRAKASGFAVLKNGPPGKGGHLAHGDCLGEQNGRVGVIAGREVEKTQRHKHLVRVLAGLELGDEFGPQNLDQNGFNKTVGAAVLGIHRKNNEMTHAVHPLRCRSKLQNRREKIGLAKTAIDPAAKVGIHGVEVTRIVREVRGEFCDGGADRRDVGAGGSVVIRIWNGTVLNLQTLQRGGCRLEGDPGGLGDKIDALNIGASGVHVNEGVDNGIHISSVPASARRFLHFFA